MCHVNVNHLHLHKLYTPYVQLYTLTHTTLNISLVYERYTSFFSIIYVGVGGRGGIKHVVITFWNMFQICKFFLFFLGLGMYLV